MSSLFNCFIVIVGITVAIYLNYPPLPQSPILYQWESAGRRFKFNNFDIFYKVELGNGTGNVLCLHGFPTSSYDWYKIFPFLKQKFKWVIALDFLGFGYSDKPRFHSYSIFEQADIVQKLLLHENINKVHILAHDYGDTVAQELLHREQNQILKFKIDSVCLLNGGIFPEKYYPRLSQKVLTLPIIGTIISKLISFPFVKAGLCEVFGPNTQPHSEELHNFWSIMRYQEGYRAWGSILNYIQERKDNEERWVAALQKTTIPVYMIYGPADPVNPPPFAEHYRNMIPKPRITVLHDHIGHYVQLEAPEELIKNYFNFLDTLSNNS